MIKYHLSHDMDILFVGINPSPGTYVRKVPFSGNKTFWYHLSDAGLIAEDRAFLRDDRQLKKLYNTKFNQVYHYGLINLVDRPSRSIADLRAGEEEPGVKRLLRVIKRYQPRIVCFVGKITYEKFAGKKLAHFGWQHDIENSKVYAMHAPIHSLASVCIRELKTVKKASLTP